MPSPRTVLWRLPVLALLGLLQHGHALVPLRPPGRQIQAPRRQMRVYMSEQIPQEVIEAEAKSTPGRPYRIGGAVLAGVGGFGVGTLHLLAIAGLDFGAPPPLFDNIVASAALELGLGTGGAAALLSELQNKQENQQRIWEELKRRREKRDEAPGKGKNRESRRRKKGMASAPEPIPMGPATSSPKAEAKESGMLESLIQKAEEAMPEANAMAQAGAMNLNSALEDAGVLDPVAQRTSPEGQAEEAAAEAPMSRTQAKKLSKVTSKKSKKKGGKKK